MAMEKTLAYWQKKKKTKKEFHDIGCPNTEKTENHKNPPYKTSGTNVMGDEK